MSQLIVFALLSILESSIGTFMCALNIIKMTLKNGYIIKSNDEEINYEEINEHDINSNIVLPKNRDFLLLLVPGVNLIFTTKLIMYSCENMDEIIGFLRMTGKLEHATDEDIEKFNENETMWNAINIAANHNVNKKENDNVISNNENDEIFTIHFAFPIALNIKIKCSIEVKRVDDNTYEVLKMNGKINKVSDEKILNKFLAHVVKLYFDLENLPIINIKCPIDSQEKTNEDQNEQEIENFTNQNYKNNYNNIDKGKSRTRKK